MQKICKYISKFFLTIFLFTTIFGLFANVSYASTEMIGGDFGSNLSIEMSDIANNTNRLLIETSLPINENPFFDNGGLLYIILDYYDPITDNKYTLKNGEDYGQFTVNGEPKILGTSTLSLKEKGGFFEKNDTLAFGHVYKEGGNYIFIDKKKTTIEVDEEIGWDNEVALDSIQGTLKFTVPVKAKSTASADDQKITSLIAEIKISKNGIIFDSGVKKETSTGASNDDNTSSTSNNKVTQKIGFSGEGLKSPAKNEYKGISSETNLEVFIVGLTNFVLSFVATIAVIMLIYGGYLWIVDQGDDQLTEKGKKIIAGSVIGILIIISAYTIVNTVIRLEGNTYEGCDASMTIGNGTDFDLNCNIETSNALVGAGVGAVAGNYLGGLLGGDDGNLIGGLLGGLGGGLLGGLFP